jgi:hypothetical protein
MLFNSEELQQDLQAEDNLHCLSSFVEEGMQNITHILT